MNKYYEVYDGWFRYFVNADTGEKKFQLGAGDIEVTRQQEDFCRQEEIFPGMLL